MRREVPEGGGSTRGARVPFADAREPGPWRPTKGDGGRAAEERGVTRAAREAKAKREKSRARKPFGGR